MDIPRDKLTAEDVEKIHTLATRIIVSMADCGPIVVSNVGGIKKETCRLTGFQAKKAREIIKDVIEDFFLKGY